MTTPSIEDLMEFLDGFMETAENLPDGAYMAFCEDGVKDFNQSEGTSFDPHDSMLMWMQR